MPPSITTLPARAGSLKFSQEDVKATIELLGQLGTGQAVRLTDKPDEKDTTARRRAEIMREQIEAIPGAVPAGYKLRGHVLTAGLPEVRKISGKNYKFYPENWGAVSMVVDEDNPAPEEDPENMENPGEESGEDAPASRRGRR